MRQDEANHVFVSYVREDNAAIDKLCDVFTAAGIPFWRDRTALAPGDAWKAEIRKAIREGSLVFLACFSDNSRAKMKSHMNEELTLAIEEFRQMPPGRTWLIPIRLDQGDLPSWDLGAGRSLTDLNYVDLFGDGYTAQVASLVTTIHRLIGDKRPSPASALAAVEQVLEAARPELLKRLTKEMLPDSGRRIELDDLVSQEIRRVSDSMADSSKFPVDTVRGSGDEQVLALVDTAQQYWTLVEPFCNSLQVASRWASPESLTPWATGLKAFVNSAGKVRPGNTAALALQHLPAVLSIMVAAVSCTAANRWANLKSLIIDPSVTPQSGQNQAVRLIEAVDPYMPFDSGDWVPNTLARVAVHGDSPAEALSHFTAKRGGKYYTPIAEWMHVILRPVFADQIPGDDDYSVEFDKAEVMLGFLSQDAATLKFGASQQQWRARSRWFGRSTHRAANYHGNAVQYFDEEFQAAGPTWGPLAAGLFGGDVARARQAIDSYAELFNEIKQRRF